MALAGRTPLSPRFNYGTNSGTMRGPHHHVLDDRAAGRLTAHADNGEIEAAYIPDLAEELDSREEQFAERHHIPLAAAQGILRELDEAIDAEASIALRKELATFVAAVAGILHERCKNRMARDMGFVFAFGLSHRFAGIRDIAHAARQLNCTRALLSRYKRKWDELLPPGVRVYGKSPEACASYTSARLRKLGYREKPNENGSNPEHSNGTTPAK